MNSPLGITQPGLHLLAEYCINFTWQLHRTFFVRSCLSNGISAAEEHLSAEVALSAVGLKHQWEPHGTPSASETHHGHQTDGQSEKAGVDVAPRILAHLPPTLPKNDVGEECGNGVESRDEAEIEAGYEPAVVCGLFPGV